MTWRKRAVYLVIVICLTITAWVTALEWITYDVDHYMKEFEKQGWVPAAGMDRMNLAYTAEEIIQYLKGEKDDFQTIAVKDGELQPLYDERERIHMVDVLNLYDRARFLRSMSLVLALLLTGFMVFRDGRWKTHWLRMLTYTGLGNVLLMALLYLLIRLDFTRYFTQFHLLFFDNDLWILDPRRHVLIQMLPESFFMNTAMKIGLAAMGSMTVLGVSACILERKLKGGKT